MRERFSPLLEVKGLPRNHIDVLDIGLGQEPQTDPDTHSFFDSQPNTLQRMSPADAWIACFYPGTLIPERRFARRAKFGVTNHFILELIYEPFLYLIESKRFWILAVNRSSHHGSTIFAFCGGKVPRAGKLASFRVDCESS